MNPKRAVTGKVPWRVDAASTFLERMDVIAAFMKDVQGWKVLHALADKLETRIIPNLLRFPRMGRLYTDEIPRSIEALTELGQLPVEALREFRQLLHGDFAILYVVDEPAGRVHLLSIRHHREMSFQG